MTEVMTHRQRVFRRCTIAKNLLYALGLVGSVSLTNLAVNFYYDYANKSSTVAEGEIIKSSEEYLSAKKDFNPKNAQAEVPERFLYAFNGISHNYIRGIHDCDDMGQEFKDVLVRGRVPKDRIRQVHGISINENIGHWWEEVLTNRNNKDEWRAFDLSGKRFNYPHVLMTGDYKILGFYSSDFVYNVDGGYSKIGDQWNSAGNCWTNVNDESMANSDPKE